MKRLIQFKTALMAAIFFGVTFSSENAIADHPRGGLDNGDTAPNFSLPDIRGQTSTLNDHEGSENVVLVFYRGQW